MRSVRIGFVLLLLAFVAYVLASTYGLRATARMVPWVIALPTLVLLLAVLAGEFLAAEKPEAGMPFATEARLFGGAVAWIAALFAATYFFGFLISVTVFLLAYFTLAARLRFWRSLAATAVVVGIIWALFVKGMGMRVFEGTLFGAIVPPL